MKKMDGKKGTQQQKGCKQNKEQEAFLYLLFPAEKIGKIFDQKKRCSGASQISHQLVR